MGTTPIARNSHREDLIDAAEAIVTEQGVGELTLERVAARAGVTKGGLIYHYKTRDALLQALVERLTSKIEERFEAGATARGDSIEGLLQAMIDDAFDMRHEEKTLMANLLAAVSTHPNQLGPVRRMYERINGTLAAAGEHAGTALMISCALDGLLFMELLDIQHFSDEQRQQMRDALVATVKQISTR